ncbi:MAG: hypothetical protein QXW83_00170 [Nitrososphaerales archaeon]
MEDNNWVSFVARIERKRRIWIPRAVWDLLKLSEGDIVEVKIKSATAKRGEL